MTDLIDVIKEKIDLVHPWPDLDSEDKDWYQDAERVLSEKEYERAKKCSTSGMQIGYLMALKELEEVFQQHG